MEAAIRPNSLTGTECQGKNWKTAHFGKSRGVNQRGGRPMANAYPQFRSSYSHEEMVEHFLLTPAELQLVLTCRGDVNVVGWRCF